MEKSIKKSYFTYNVSYIMQAKKSEYNKVIDKSNMNLVTAAVLKRWRTEPEVGIIMPHKNPWKYSNQSTAVYGTCFNKIGSIIVFQFITARISGEEILYFNSTYLHRGKPVRP